MNRRSFFQRVRPSPAADSARVEVLPGVFVDGRLPVRWSYDHPERDTPAPRDQSAFRGASTGLEPYVPSDDAPWDRRRVLHLLRRSGYGATPADIETVAAVPPLAAVDAIVDAAASASLPPTPDWFDVPPPSEDAPPSEIEAFIESTVEWRLETLHELCREGLTLRTAGTALRERLAVVWHGHFATEVDVYFLSRYLYDYLTLLRTHAFGDFRTLVYEIGLTPAMLIYLNGFENRVGQPNENYARELLELFTMGITGPDGEPNYTQSDIEELSRALTGWGIDYYGTQEAVFVPFWHDTGEKTIFGQTGAWGYDDIVPLLFGQRADEIAHFVCSKIYQALVYDVPNPSVVAEMAALFVAEDFQIEPVVRTLLRSTHFFDDDVIGARIKSPLDHGLALYRESGYPEHPDVYTYLNFRMAQAGQELFNPPNVAGWPGYHAWIDTQALPVRWLYARQFLYFFPGMQALALSMPNPYDVHALAADLAAFFLGVPVSDDDLTTFTELLLNGIPDYEWNPSADGAEVRLRGLVDHLLGLPEYQLG